MKKIMFSTMLACAVASSLGACSNMTEVQHQQLQLACAADASLRPTVTALQGLMTPQENAALTAARAAIDVVCSPDANPTSQTSITAATTAITSLTQMFANIQARDKGQPLPFPNITLYGAQATVSVQAPVTGTAAATTGTTK